MRKYALIILYVSAFFSLAFSNIINRHSLELSGLLYRFSYSEEFDRQSGPFILIGFPRSDEYGSTFGGELEYVYNIEDSKLLLGVKLNYSRSMKHTYDGSLQWDTIRTNSNALIVYYQPHMEDTENFFYGANVKIGYMLSSNYSRVIFEPKLTGSFNGWKRPVGYVEYYYWSRISPGASLTTRNHENLGITSDISLSIPAWQKMYLPDGGRNYRFDIGGKVGWQFQFGLIKYLQEGGTFKITYFYEYYGFKESDYIRIGNSLYREPSSDTHRNGVKISIEKGWGK
jgi:hypothetical protein